MKAMILNSIADLNSKSDPLEMRDIPKPVPGDNEVLIKVLTCGVCHTELDEIEGRTPPPKFPVVPGHQIVGLVESTGSKVTKLRPGERVGVAWIYSSCGKCSFCLSERENLCREFRATGRDVNGGYAEYMIVHESFAYQIPPIFTNSQAAPLLCAGAVGYRSLILSGLKNGSNLGFTGFGASAHLVLQIVQYMFPKTKVYVFARSEEERLFATELGAYWTGKKRSKVLQMLPGEM